MTFEPRGPVVLTHENQRAIISKVGATLSKYAQINDALREGFGGKEVLIASQSQILYPWPNRLREGRWTFSKRTARPTVGEFEQSTAIHGLVRQLPFRIDSVTRNRCTLSLLLRPCSDYPFLTELSVAYQLDTLGLTVLTTVTNRDDVSIPFGLGFHPYLAVTTPTIEMAELEVPARTYLRVDDRGLPTGEVVPVAESVFDFSKRKNIDNTQLDTTYTNLIRDDSGITTVVVVDVTGRRVELSLDSHFPYMQVYTGDTLAADQRRTSIAVEPMTCPPDALRSGKDIVVLQPDEHWSGSWRVLLCSP